MAMTVKERLAHALKVKFGLPPDRPTDSELASIVGDAAKYGRKLTDEEWRNIVDRHVRGAQKHVYEGLDFSDLNALFAILRAQRSG
jgi:hypothetical protein